MSSGSYMAKAVLLVDIPKAKGGTRQLGIPTTCDRVAQTVVKNRLETIVEKEFHEDSYAYRPSRSPIDAVTVCRKRCFNHEWLLEIDIKGFFDNIDHDIMMHILQTYTDNKVILLYVKRFLKAKAIKGSGEEEIAREVGTPQGGVVSPVLANLFLHEAFDKYMALEYPMVKFERYADDIVVHCKTEKQAYFIKDLIKSRFKQYKLEIHPEKTKVVYTGITNYYDYRSHKQARKFTFLGYDFKPRYIKGRVVFTPSIGSGALKMIRNKIKKSWHLKQSLGSDIEEIAKKVNPVIRGWIKYYGHHRRSDLYKLQRVVNNYLVMFLKRKQKSNFTWEKAWNVLDKIKSEHKNLFCHWYMISQTERRAV